MAYSFQVGDTVVCPAKPADSNSGPGWTGAMDTYVGHVGTVHKEDRDLG